MFSPRGLACRLRSLLVKWYTSLGVEIRQKKIGLSRPAFQGHSRSPNVTRIDYDLGLLLAVNSNNGPLSYRF